jgi:hypothetical protein
MNNFQITKFEAPISTLDDVRGTTITLEEFLNDVQNGKDYNKQVGPVRAAGDIEKKRKLKKSICDYVKLSGVFETRSDSSLKQHNGIICLDFDHLEDIPSIRLQIEQDEYVMFTFISVSGDGIKVGVKIDPENHDQSFEGLKRYFLHNYKLEVDKQAKNVGRACFISYDQNVFRNPNSKTFFPDFEEIIDFDSGEVIKQPRQFNPAFSGSVYDYTEGLIKQIEDKKIDLTEDYNDWMLICFCMASLGEDGRNLFHRLSTFNAQYKPKDADIKFSNAVRTARFTQPTYFFKRCKDLGLNMSKKVQFISIPSANPDEDQTEMMVNFTISWPNNIKLSPQEKRDAQVTINDYHFFVHNHQVYFGQIRKGDMTFEDKTNFEIVPHYLITDEFGNTSRIIEFQSSRGVKTLENIETGNFTSKEAFAKHIEKHNRVASWNAKEWELYRRYFYNFCHPASQISIMGYHYDDFFAFGNGILADKKFIPTDKFGIVEYNSKKYFLPSASEMYKHTNEFESEKKFKYVDRRVGFTEWAELFLQVYGDNGKIGIMFPIMSIFSDIIYKNTGHFPFLHLYGKKSSGKSTMAQSIMSLFYQTEGQSAGQNINSTTTSSFYRLLGQIRNGIVLFEEFNNDDDIVKVEALKQIYNRENRVVSDKNAKQGSNKTVGQPIYSAVILTGQNLPIRDPALFTRTIHLSFFKNSNFSEVETKVYNRLRAMQGQGLTCVAAEIINLRSRFEEQFANHYDSMKDIISRSFKGEAAVRLTSHCAMMVAAYDCLKDVLHFPFTKEDLLNVVINAAVEQGEKVSGTEENVQFWDSLSYLLMQKLVTMNRHFVIQRKDSFMGSNDKMIEVDGSPRLLFIRIKDIAPTYMIEQRKQGKKPMDENTLKSYLKNSPAFIGNAKSLSIGGSKSSAMVFNYDMLCEDGYDFEYSELDLYDSSFQNPFQADRNKYNQEPPF